MVHAISVSVSATEFISRFFLSKHVYAIILYLDQTHYEWPSLFLDQTLFITYFEFKGLTFSWKNEQWKCTVLPDIDSRCKSFLLSVLWTTTCSRNGIPTGLKTTWQRDGWNTLYTQWKFLCKISFSEISNCHHLILQQFFHEKEHPTKFNYFKIYNISKQNRLPVILFSNFQCTLWKFKYLKNFMIVIDKGHVFFCLIKGISLHLLFSTLNLTFPDTYNLKH